MKKRRASAQALATTCAASTRPMLIRRRIYASVKTRRASHNGVELWETALEPRPPVKIPLAGTWTLHMYWRFAEDVLEGGNAHLADASIGLSVEHPIFGPSIENIVRYDYEGWGQRKAHLHVLQPGALKTKVHWLLPDRHEAPWDVDAVLEFLFSDELLTDLREGWERLCATDE